jgi:hypothetical protein
VRTVLLIEPIGIRFALREHKPEIQARLEGMPKPINITVLAIARELAGFI